MMGNTPQYRLLNQAYSYKKIRITQCDPSSGYVEGRDSANQQIQLTFAFFQSPYVQVPKVGEHWLVTKLDNNWVIHSRFEEDAETLPVGSLIGGDVRINAPSRLLINAEEEIICDFNKARNSFAELETATFPGSALYGSATLDQVNAGTVVVKDRLVTPFSTYLPSRDVAHGQEVDVLFSAGAEGTVNWRFKYNEDGIDDPWHFAGGPAYLDFNSTSIGTTGTGTAWFGTTAGPDIFIPYTGEYILSGGAEAISSDNNSGFKLGLSIEGGDPGLNVLSGFISEKNISQSVNTTYQIRLTKDQTIRIWYAKKLPSHSGTVSFFNRWMQITPIRVQANPSDEPEIEEITTYEGAG
jgi:hypothetical protein